jgi:hypothetical protein
MSCTRLTWPPSDQQDLEWKLGGGGVMIGRGSDGRDPCDNQPFRVADLFAGTGGKGSYLRNAHDCGLRYGAALWTESSRTRLFDGNDDVGCPSLLMVCLRFPPETFCS